MKIKLLLAFLVMIVVTAVAPGFDLQRRVRLQREFNLRAGSEAFVKEAGLTLRFTGLVEDSRCPEGVDCIWAGNGKINVTVKKGRRKAVSFELNTTTDPKSFTYQGYEIELERLAPYPKANVSMNKRDYIATLKVTRTNP